MTEKRILILTYYWPPSGGGGVQRWMYFAMYLKRLGYKPTVITVHPDKASYPLIDKSQLEMVKDIETIYTNTLEPLKFYSFLKSGKTNKEIPYGNLGENSGGVFSKAMAFVRSNFFVPDARKGWVSYAKKAAEKIIKPETSIFTDKKNGTELIVTTFNYDWVITTGPPHSTHLAGLFLSKKFNIKWLADFRDPWSEIYFLQNTYRFNFAKQKDEELESLVLNSADIVTTVGPGMADLLRKKMKNPEKLHILYNGYDKEMFEGIEKRSTKNNQFIISHIGLLGDTQRLDSFIEALKKVDIDKSKILLHLAGSVHPVHLEKLKTDLPDVHLIHKGFLPRKDALTLMKNSDLLLLCPPMVGQTRLIVSTKTMEYLAAGVPILGIGDEQSDAATLVKQQGISGFYDPEDLEGISRFISESFQNWKLDNISKNDFNPEPYSRLAVTDKLAEILG
ncbi:MAG: glycosyltransferase family 4 protein [Bacteroidia bacterium]